jgi:hypothetical protein
VRTVGAVPGFALGWQKRPEKLLHFEALRREMAKNLLCH